MDFIAYLLFIVCGWIIGGIIVYPVYRYMVSLEPRSEKKGWIAAGLAALMVIFGASR